MKKTIDGVEIVCPDNIKIGTIFSSGGPNEILISKIKEKIPFITGIKIVSVELSDIFHDDMWRINADANVYDTNLGMKFGADLVIENLYNQWYISWKPQPI